MDTSNAETSGVEQNAKNEHMTLLVDDGTLTLVGLASSHPTIQKSIQTLTELYPQINNAISRQSDDIKLDDLTSIERETRGFLDSINNITIELDCIDLDNLRPEWGERASVRQCRKEVIHMATSVTLKCEELQRRLATLRLSLPPPSLPGVSGVNFEEIKAKLRSSLPVGTPTSDPSPGDKRSATDTPPAHDPSGGADIDGVELAGELPTQGPPRKKKKKKKKEQIDWQPIVEDKLLALTSRIYRNREKAEEITTNINIRARMGKHISALRAATNSGESISSTLLKESIETLVDGIKVAFQGFADLQFNQASLKSLYESCCAVETFKKPSELLDQMVSMEGLLKTL